MKTYKTIENIPTWALCYLVNGDGEGLTDEEVAQIEHWYNENKVEFISPETDEECNIHTYFTHYPAFGLSTEVADCIVICRE